MAANSKTLCRLGKDVDCKSKTMLRGIANPALRLRMKGVYDSVVVASNEGVFKSVATASDCQESIFLLQHFAALPSPCPEPFPQYSNPQNENIDNKGLARSADAVG